MCNVRLFRGGFTAVENLSRWVSQKQILEHPAVRNLSVIAAAFGKMMMSREFMKMMNSEAIELLSRRAWGTMKAFDEVRSRDDWKKPSSAKNDWKSRVNWSVLEAIDAVGADTDRLEIPELEDELRKKFKDKALLDKAKPDSSEAASATDGLLAPTS